MIVSNKIIEQINELPTQIGIKQTTNSTVFLGQLEAVPNVKAATTAREIPQ
jgi:hypothetical protein